MLPRSQTEGRLPAGPTPPSPSLRRTSFFATVLSDLFAVIGFLAIALAIYALYGAFANTDPYRNWDDLAVTFLVISFFILMCFGWSVILRAISHALNALKHFTQAAAEEDLTPPR
jgi:uncharacterized membrane protein YccC